MEIKLKRKRTRNVELLRQRKADKARVDGFLNFVLEMPTRADKVNAITKANPYHYILFTPSTTNTGESK